MTSVVHGLQELDHAPSVVTIGNFDGVHRGHQILLRRTVHLASELAARSVAVTFDPHPTAVLRPDAEPPRLQTLEDRIASLSAVGVDVVVVLPFTRELAARSPAAFVAEVLAGELEAVRVVVGTNFRFGHKAAGDVVTLLELGEEHGFAPEAVTLLEIDGRRISSSSIREHLTDGDLAWVVRALGRPYLLRGEVVRGDGRGRGIGFPTANLEVDEGVVIPATGVYAGHAEVAGGRYPAVTNVGLRPTFDGTVRTVEVHVLDLDTDLYGQRIGFSFEHRIRAEQRFEGVEALVAQIGRDVAESRRLLEA